MAKRAGMKVTGLDGLEKRLLAIRSKRGHRAMLGNLAGATVGEAKRQAPKKTKHLSREISFKNLSESGVDIVSAAEYSAAVEFGTKPHTIKPRRAKALRFATGAAGRRLTGTARRGADVVFARSVKHPGTKKQPFLMPAVVKVLKHSGKIGDQIVRRWNQAD